MAASEAAPPRSILVRPSAAGGGDGSGGAPSPRSPGRAVRFADPPEAAPDAPTVVAPPVSDAPMGSAEAAPAPVEPAAAPPVAQPGAAPPPAVAAAARVLAGLAWLIVTYAPASHAFMYVAFVVAERTLYLPSLGVAVVLAEAWVAWDGGAGADGGAAPAATDGGGGDAAVPAAVPAVAADARATGGDHGLAAPMPAPPAAPAPRGAAPAWRWRSAATGPRVVLAAALCAYGVRAGVRNLDWVNEEALLASNLALYPSNNGMSMYGLGAVRYYQGRADEAEALLLAATQTTTLAEPHIMLGQLYWRHRRNFTAAIEALSRIENTTSPRKEVLQNLGLLLMSAGRAPDSDGPARTRAEYLVLAGHAAHGYPMGHPNIAHLASNAGCVRMTSEPWRYGNFELATRLFADALTAVHAARVTATRNAAYFHAVAGRPDTALAILDGGDAFVTSLLDKPSLPPDAVAEADGFRRSFAAARVAITTALPSIVGWADAAGAPGAAPLSKAEVERRLALIGGECVMELLHW